MNKVSIIVPAYNTGKYIKKCIDSILSQTYQDFEVIIVDDCSTDNGMDIVCQYKDTRIKIYQNEKNSGPSFSRNRGIERATGSYIAILDSDDWWEENRLEILMDFAIKKDADMVFDDLLYIRENETAPWTTYFKFKNMTVNEPINVTPEYFVDYDLGILKAIIRKDFLTKNQLVYDESIKYGEDFILYLDITTKSDRVWLLPKAYYYYLSREDSLVKSTYKLTVQCIESTDELLKKPAINQRPTLVQSLLKRKRDFTIIKIYHETDYALKERHYIKALVNFMKYPKVARMRTMVKLRETKYRIFPVNKGS